MSFGSIQDVKERIREAVDLVEYVGSDLPLRRQGRNYVALCPWHDDQRPSLQINPERQIWKCWVCNLGGDIFSYVMQREGIGFREALQLLADRAGIPLTPHPSRGGEKRDDKAQLYEATTWAEQQFHQCLLSADEGSEARHYLEQRGRGESAVQRFRLGFSPNGWQWLLDRSRSTPYSAEQLDAVGLLGKSQASQRWYDRFRGRVIFPIRDTSGRTIAFGGRILPALADERTAKYINSPETRLFSKSDQLYGLDFARDAVVKSREVVVVEGYTDVVMAQQAGLHNVVAVLGTALGERHIRLLRRFADQVTLVLDGDEAGQRRTNEVLQLFVAAQVDLRILTLPQELDPCDFIRQQGGDAFRSLLDTAVDALEHRVRTVMRGVDPVRDTHRANQALEAILSTMAQAPRIAATDTQAAGLREQLIMSRLAREFQVPEEKLRQRLKELRRSTRRVSTKTQAAGPPAHSLTPEEREMLEILLLHSELVPLALENISAEELASEDAREVFRIMRQRQASNRRISFEDVLTEVEEARLKTLLVDLYELGRSKAKYALEQPEQRLGDLIRDFDYRAKRRQRQEFEAPQPRQEKQPQDDETEALRALEEMIQLERERRGISAPTDG